jgi:hypothetical protein
MDYFLKTSPAETPQRRYVDYLVKRLTDWRMAGQKLGQKFGGAPTIVITMRILKKQLGCSLYTPERFEEICAFIKGKIDNTFLGRRNQSRHVRSYHTFTEHGVAKRLLQTKVKELPPIAPDEHRTSNIEQPTSNEDGSQGTARPTLSKRQLSAAQDRLRILRAAWNIWSEFPEAAQGEVAVQIGVNNSKFSGLLALCQTRGEGRLNSRARCERLLFGADGDDQHGAITRVAPGQTKQDDADFLPSETETAIVRSIYARLDESTPRNRGRGSSKILAFRLAAKSEEYRDRVSEAFRQTVLTRKTKSVPPSWSRLLDVPASVLRAVRDKRSITAHSISTPRGRTYVDANGYELPIQPGTIFEADDGTLNFYATIPWPFGGDKCSDKFGVKLARWQLLAVADVASEQCVAVDIVCRSLGQYRGEDSAALLGRTMMEVCEPELWRLERGSWESQMVRGAMELCHVPVTNAWHSKQKNVIERFFDRLWTPASLIPGHVGRDADADKFKQIYDIVIACQDGRRDPRDYFLTLTEAAPKVYKAIEFVNSEPIESGSGWGTWVPQERYQTHMDANPRQRLDAQFKTFFAREQREWKIRQCCVGGSVNGPLIKFPTYFQCAELWEFDGCRARCFFDPYAETVTGTIVLLDTWRDYKPGHVIARDVPALELPPQAILASEWDDEGSRRSLAIRKQLAKAVRTEMWNWLGTSRREVRSGAAVLIHDLDSVRSPKSEVRNSTDALLQSNGRDLATGLPRRITNPTPMEQPYSLRKLLKEA